jgi:flagellar biosynthesis protein FlhA
VTGGFLALLIFTSLPRLPLSTLGLACVGLAHLLNRKSQLAAKADAHASEAKKHQKPDERIEDYLTVDPMEIELGVGLIRLADPNRGGDLLERVQRVRQNIAAEIGIIMPKVRIRDNLRLDQNEYRVKIADTPVAGGEVLPGNMLAIDSGTVSGHVDGLPTKDPAFGTDAKWISPANQDQAEMYGYTVVEPGAILATHLTEVVRKHADEILTRDATKHLVNELKNASPAVVDELVPKVLSLAEVQQILQILLREQVPIRQLATILETLGDYAPRSKDPILLTEYVRHRLARQICSRYRDQDDCLHVVTLDPTLEDQIRAGCEHTERGLFVRLPPLAIESMCRRIAAETQKLTAQGRPPILLVSPQIRAAVKQVTDPHIPRLVVLSYNEVTRDTKVESIGMVSGP